MPNRRWIVFVSLVAAISLWGCGREDGSPEVEARLEAQTPVVLVKVEGETALVETEGGEQYYVERSVVQSRRTDMKVQEGNYTHVLSTSTNAYIENPIVPPKEEPRTRQEISAEQSSLNRLFLTAKTNRRILAPSQTATFVDPVTGEPAWPAFTCHNSKCPKRGTEDEPYLFIFSDREQRQTCPACAEENDPDSFSTRELRRYLSWTRPYTLPETARRIKELDAERKRASKRQK